jgi:hypothetical protein
MRAITASGLVPSTIAGRIRCFTVDQNEPLSPVSSESIKRNPVVGSM